MVLCNCLRITGGVNVLQRQDKQGTLETRESTMIERRKGPDSTAEYYKTSITFKNKAKPRPIRRPTNAITTQRPRRTNTPRRNHTPLPPALGHIDRRPIPQRRQSKLRSPALSNSGSRIPTTFLYSTSDPAANREDGDIFIVVDDVDGWVGACCAEDGGEVCGLIAAC